MIRVYYFKNIGTIEMGSAQELKNVIAITELPMNGMPPQFRTRAESAEFAIQHFLDQRENDGIDFKFLISKELR
jgi:hypothetical protein